MCILVIACQAMSRAAWYGGTHESIIIHYSLDSTIEINIQKEIKSIFRMLKRGRHR